MTKLLEVLGKFSPHGTADILYMPDLTLWYEWHSRRGTLPSRWAGLSIAEIARDMGVPAWTTVRPWRAEHDGVSFETQESDGERLVQYETERGTLRARWSLGPDGDWWQMEYPVKDASDLPAALSIVEARRYVPDPERLDNLADSVGDDGVVAIQLPRRPYSDLLHEFLGWDQGLMLLVDKPAEIGEMLSLLEVKLAALELELLALPGDLALAPDSLDGQFISPPAFGRHMKESYRKSAERLHAGSKAVVVHVGGPVRRLLAELAASGVDGVEGIAGPPQGDVSLSQGRELAGSSCTLWGGISQDVLLKAHSQDAFEAAVREAVEQAVGDPRAILGVADKVPVDADVDRLVAIPSLIEASGGQ